MIPDVIPPLFPDYTRNHVVIDTKIDAENIYANAICGLAVIGECIPDEIVHIYNKCVMARKNRRDQIKK